MREYTITGDGMSIGEPYSGGTDFLGPATGHGTPSTEPKQPRFAPPTQ